MAAIVDDEKPNHSAAVLQDGDANDEMKKQLADNKDLPAGTNDLTPEEVELNKRVNRKMDMAMLPVLSLLYLFNGLDKGNVGNAETQGLSAPFFFLLALAHTVPDAIFKSC